MKAEWISVGKKQEAITPANILNYLESISIISSENKVSFQLPDFQIWFSEREMIREFICFPNHADPDNTILSQCIKHAVNECILAGNVTPNYFLNTLNSKLGSINPTEVDTYALTTLSIVKPKSYYKIKVFNSTIYLYKNEFPSKYNNYRKDAFKKIGIENKEQGYTKCVIYNHSPSMDINSLLNNFHIFRSVLCLFNSNRWNVRFDRKKSPINPVRTGYAHTLHDTEGAIINSGVWYESNFVATTPLEIDQIKKNSILKIINRIERSPYSDDLKKSLLVYVAALDEYDHNVTLMMLWNSIDILLNTKKGNYNDIPDRIKKIFDGDLTKYDVIQAIKFRRNKYVHETVADEHTLSYCFELRKIYIGVLNFHLKICKKYDSIKESLFYLDSI